VSVVTVATVTAAAPAHLKRDHMTNFDTIIVGAGSSGSVLATRLTEDPDRRVLLIEAGPHFRTLDEFPEIMRSADVLRAAAPDHPASWKFPTMLTDTSPYIVPRGRVVGGGSAVNGALYTWPTRVDFEEWQRAAGEPWGPEAMYPMLRRIERDLDFGEADGHGTDGPIGVERPAREAWAGIAAGFVEACKDMGHPFDADMNRDGSIGVGPVPANSIGGIRQNTAITYLAGALGRPNLTIAPNTEIHRVRLEGTTARGVEGVGPQGPVTYEADEVVICAGAIKSAQLLMVSGIGPGEELRRHGIDVVQESPGVGTDTTDHCVIRLWYRARGATKIPVHVGAAFQVGLHYASSPGVEANDMCLLPTAVSMNDMLLSGSSVVSRARMLMSAARSVPLAKVVDQVRRGWQQNIGVLIMNGESRGRVRLASSDPTDVPLTEHHYLEQEADRGRLREAVRLGSAILRSPRYGDAGVSGVQPLISETASDAELDSYCKEHLGTANHLSSTCRMGTEHTASTVVDPECRVFGVTGLRVADTSVMHSPSRRNTNTSALVIGERVAEMMR
jgi:choline dehydrogenase